MKRLLNDGLNYTGEIITTTANWVFDIPAKVFYTIALLVFLVDYLFLPVIWKVCRKTPTAEPSTAS